MLKRSFRWIVVFLGLVLIWSLMSAGIYASEEIDESEIEETLAMESVEEEAETGAEETELVEEEAETEAEETELVEEEIETEAEAAEIIEEETETCVSPAVDVSFSYEAYSLVLHVEENVISDGVSFSVEADDEAEAVIRDVLYAAGEAPEYYISRIAAFHVSADSEPVLSTDSASFSGSISLSQDMLSLFSEKPDAMLRVYQIVDSKEAILLTAAGAASSDSAFSDSAFSDSALLDSVSSDGASSDGVSSDGASSDNASSNSPVFDGSSLHFSSPISEDSIYAACLILRWPDPIRPEDFYQAEVSQYDEMYAGGVYNGGVEGDDRLQLLTAGVTDVSYILPYLPIPQDQGSYGCCWAFSTLASAETALNKSHQQTIFNFSEAQLAYSAYHPPVDPLGNLTDIDETSFTHYGYQEQMAGDLLAGWQGPVPESVVPYSQMGAISESNYLDPAIILNSSAQLTDYFVVNPREDREGVKRMLLTYGSLAFSYCPYNAYNATNNCFYQPQEGPALHSISIVGWDDSFSRKNFKSEANKNADGTYTYPPADGAWLCRNSWTSTTSFDYNGYFWMSYYEASMTDYAVCFKMQPKGYYDNNYQYDGCQAGYTTKKAVDAGDFHSTFVANVFTANSGAASETLRAVGFRTIEANVSYRVTIFTDVTGTTNPQAGVKAVTQSGTLTYPGYHTVTLTTPVALSKGTKFSVVIALQRADGTPSPAVYRSTRQPSLPHLSAGQSYIYNNEEARWEDWYDACGTPYADNFIIKAYTNNDTVPHLNVIFDPNGGTGDMEGLWDIAVGTYYTLPANVYKKTGYHFIGWSLKADGSGALYPDQYNKFRFSNESAKYGNVTTLYAVWEPNEYTVRFKPNYGTGTAPATMTVKYGESITMPANTFTKTGYKFSCWNKKLDGSGKDYKVGSNYKNLTSTQNGTVTLYAKWTPIKYSIHYAPNGGSGTMADMTGIAYGEEVELSPNGFTRKGYIFTGWNTKKDGTGTYFCEGELVQSLNKTDGTTRWLYAQWLPTTYKIKFNANGGTGTMSQKTCTYDVSTTLPDNKFTKAGYTFLGWSTTTKKTDIKYINKGTVKNLSSTGQTVTLYAVWTKTENKAVKVTVPIVNMTKNSTATFRISSVNGYTGSVKVENCKTGLMKSVSIESKWGASKSGTRKITITTGSGTGNGLIKITNGGNDGVIWVLVHVTAN